MPLRTPARPVGGATAVPVGLCGRALGGLAALRVGLGVPATDGPAAMLPGLVPNAILALLGWAGLRTGLWLIFRDATRSYQRP